ncbi:hypothetical protein GIB67_026577 [Kingdonia uniflora]|uniref:PGG domain-containing protein n=1 Tax=Kingdonia uniflora TaxID=39325 RepID=A0A7J7NNB6_9MAGN|nr:hypothetical protein GIB67_026577 [Kingdonia uniflora]
MGFNTAKRRTWAQSIIEDNDEKKGTLAVQSIRNCLMASTLTATIAAILNSSLAALTNNTYNAAEILKNSFFGSQSDPVLTLKYCSASVFLLTSFLCSTMAVGFLNEANFLMNVSEFSPGYVHDMLERGFLFAFIGHRMLYVTFTLLLWMFGPIPMALSSMAMVWVLYGLDFII